MPAASKAAAMAFLRETPAMAFLRTATPTPPPVRAVRAPAAPVMRYWIVGNDGLLYPYPGHPAEPVRYYNAPPLPIAPQYAASVATYGAAGVCGPTGSR